MDNCEIQDRNEVSIKNIRETMVDGNELFEHVIEPIFDEQIVRRTMPERNRRLQVRFKYYDLEYSFLTYSEVLKTNNGRKVFIKRCPLHWRKIIHGKLLINWKLEIGK